MTFEQSIEGARGTITWVRASMRAMKVEVVGSGDGYVTVERWDSDECLRVPTHAILHFQFAGEDD